MVDRPLTLHRGGGRRWGGRRLRYDRAAGRAESNEGRATTPTYSYDLPCITGFRFINDEDDVTCRYMPLRDVTRCYATLHGVTRRYTALRDVTQLSRDVTVTLQI